MGLEAIQARLKEIQGILAKGEGNVEELKQEVEQLTEQRKKIMEDVETRKKLLSGIAEGTYGVTVRQAPAEVEDNEFDIHEAIATDTYRRAFLKSLLNEEMSVKEKRVFDEVQAAYRAFTHTTTNTAAVVAKSTATQIMSAIEESHPIIKDVNVVHGGALFAVTHTKITEGDAKNVAEGEANADEKNEFASVTLAGQDISKHVEYSYALGLEAIDSFEAYLVKEIADRISSQWAKNIVAQIKKDVAAGNKINAAKAGTLAIDDVLKGLASIKTSGKLTVYTTNATLYGNIVSLKGAEGQSAYIPNYQDNIRGVLFGAEIKLEDALTPGEILIINPQDYVENVVQDILIERDKDIKRHVHVIAGYMRAGGKLKTDKSAAIVTVGTGA